MAESSWPRDRIPTREELQGATEAPQSNFLLHFKQALLQAHDVENYHKFVHDDLFLDKQNSGQSFTYPLSVLVDFPTLPSSSSLNSLRSTFSATFQTHIYLNIIGTFAKADADLPPYLNLALACIGSCMQDEHRDALLSNQLFHAARKLWMVLMETDNRETRMLEPVLAAALIVNYGVLANDLTVLTMTERHHAQMMTMVSRLQFPHHTHGSDAASFRDKLDKTWPYLILLDVLQCLHTNAAIRLSTAEFPVCLPASRHAFSSTFAKLTSENGQVPKDILAPEDALLLLLALISEYLVFERSSKQISSDLSFSAQTSGTPGLVGPCIPLSASTEYARILSTCSTTGHQWHKHFSSIAPQSILALYHYFQLRLSCPLLQNLSFSGDSGAFRGLVSTELDASTSNFTPSEASLQLAWAVLDHVDVSTKDIEQRMVSWLPIVLFHAALVVRYWSCSAREGRSGSLRILDPFIAELQSLPWPCCTEMVKCLRGST